MKAAHKITIEFEWKSLFSETSQKVGNQCKKRIVPQNKVATTKQWRVRLDKPDEQTDVTATPNMIPANNIRGYESESWTKVSKSCRDKGNMLLW